MVTPIPLFKWQQALLLLVILLWCLPSGTRADDDDDDGGVDSDNLFQNYSFMELSGAVPEHWTLTGGGGVIASTVNSIANSQGMGLDSRDPSNPSVFSQRVNSTRNTEYSVTFWAYRNTSTATLSSGSHNLSLSFGSQSWSVDPPTHWTNYSFTTQVTDPSTNVQWSSYDVSGAEFVIGWPCFFFTDGSDEGPTEGGSSTSMISAAPTLHNSSNKSTTKSTTVVGGAIGGALGGVIVMLLLAGLLLWRRKKNQEKHITTTKNQDISPTETEEGKAPQQFNSAPWTIPHLRNEQPAHTYPATATTATTADVNLNRNTSVHTTSNSHVNVSSRHDSSVPPLTYSSSPATPSPTFLSGPPEYGPSSPRSISSSRSLSHALQLHGMAGAPFIDDEVGRWAAANRDNISPELEQKLRDAHYRPSDDPREITDNIWNDRYGVGHYELKRIQELYQRQSLASDIKAKDMHGSGQGGLSWRNSNVGS